ncbi:MAG: hypothetical protein E7191_05290 [Erysipelotrichaceae bacterium]|nr:hypothetical protein [Erysipelotrichaceae bacterium]
MKKILQRKLLQFGLTIFAITFLVITILPNILPKNEGSSLVFLLCFLILLIIYVLSNYFAEQYTLPIRAMLKDPTHYDQFYDDFLPIIKEYRSSRDHVTHNNLRIAAEQQKLVQLIENMNNGFLLLDSNKNVDLVNKAFLEITNCPLTTKTAYGRSYSDLTDNETLCTLIARCKKITGAANFMIDKRYLHFTISPICIKDNNFYLCLLNDISYLYENEKQRIEFTANVSHELKTPLTSIIGYSQLIHEGIASFDDAKAFCLKIDKEANRMLHLINNIIELSFLDEKTEDDKQTHLLPSLLQTIIDRLEPKIQENNITITLDLQENEIYGNEKQLDEMISNIVSNAIRYNKLNGSLHIHSHCENDHTVLSFQDTGIGVSEEDRKHLFERFYRVDKSRSKETGGTGLGLAIVKHIVHRHNGTIHFESILGEGSTLTVSLPKDILNK